jgi:hypothetical protein
MRRPGLLAEGLAMRMATPVMVLALCLRAGLSF